MTESKESSLNSILPADWEILPFKSVYKTSKGLSITKADLVEKGVPVINYGQIHSKTSTFFDSCNLPFVPQSYLNESARLERGDIVFADTSEDINGSGNFSIKDSDEIILAGYHNVIAKPIKEVNYRWIGYVLESSLFKSQIQSKVKGVKVFSITQRMINNTKIWLPPKEIQKKIIDVLDNNTAFIDEIIKKTQASIAKLKLYKQSIVTEALTKGHNRDVHLKSSGIEWAKQIPENWSTVKMKRLFSITKIIANSNEFDVLSVTQQGLKIKDLDANKGQYSNDYSKYQIVKPGYFVMNHMDLLTGWVDYSKYEGVTSPDYRVFKIVEANFVFPAYYLYLFQMLYTNKIFYGSGQGVSSLGRWRLQTDKFNNFYIPLPPYEEQVEIAEYLQKELLRIDNLLEKKQLLIEKFETYKKSLIYEYVTGKKAVE